MNTFIQFLKEGKSVDAKAAIESSLKQKTNARLKEERHVVAAAWLQESHQDTLDFVKDKYGPKAVEPHNILSQYGYKFKNANSKGDSVTAVYKHPKTKHTADVTHSIERNIHRNPAANPSKGSPDKHIYSRANTIVHHSSGFDSAPGGQHLIDHLDRVHSKK